MQCRELGQSKTLRTIAFKASQASNQFIGHLILATRECRIRAPFCACSAENWDKARLFGPAAPPMSALIGCEHRIDSTGADERLAGGLRRLSSNWIGRNTEAAFTAFTSQQRESRTLSRFGDWTVKRRELEM